MGRIGVSKVGYRSRTAAFALAFVAAALSVLFLVGAQPFDTQSARAYAAEVAASPQADLAGVGGVAAKAQSAAKPSKKKLKAFKQASADFGIELLKRCVAAQGGNANVTVAPTSVLTALAMTANGAGGKTAKQMRAVLADGLSMKALNKSLKWFNGQLKNVKGARISSANAIWYHNGGSLSIRKSFLKVNRKYLGADVRPADFSNPATVDGINGWVAEKTNNMIKRLVDQLDADARVVLANALYFDAEWLAPYDKGDVHTAPFTTGSGDKRDVDMMYSREHQYIEGYGATGFIRPYVKGYSYVALLPDQGTSLKSFVSKLDGATFRKLVTKTTTPLVNAGLPKYSLEYSNEDMGAQLAAMGMPLAFNRDKANFKKMGTDSTGNLYIGEVVHKTKIELDELGTKAAAVTGIVMKANAAPFGEVKTVILNRPFVYAIIDNATKLPVFIGTVNDIGR